LQQRNLRIRAYALATTTAVCFITMKAGFWTAAPQVDTLPGGLSGVVGGGRGASQAEKPWVIFFQPFVRSRQVGFCPTDRTPRSQFLATDLNGYNGGITSTSKTPPPTSEQSLAEAAQRSWKLYLCWAMLRI
jgi:hypothetical protein